jgi:hypothetical protein
LIGRFSFTDGAHCHATFRITGGRVTQILYSGERHAAPAPHAYCAPIMRIRIARLRGMAAPNPAR